MGQKVFKGRLLESDTEGDNSDKAETGPSAEVQSESKLSQDLMIRSGDATTTSQTPAFSADSDFGSGPAPLEDTMNGADNKNDEGEGEDRDMSEYTAPIPKHVMPAKISVFGDDPRSVSIKLMPHQHTLFCERKERVCTALGKIQELEVLKVFGLAAPPLGCYWIRSEPGNKYSSYTYIEGSEKSGISYSLTSADAGCYISFQQTVLVPESAFPSPSDTSNSSTLPFPSSTDGVISNEEGATHNREDESAGAANPLPSAVAIGHRVRTSIGPILPGPPRLLDLTIEGDMQCGGRVYAVANYIGGTEGASEYWWFRINGGKRQQLGDPQPIALNSPLPDLAAGATGLTSKGVGLGDMDSSDKHSTDNCSSDKVSRPLSSSSLSLHVDDDPRVLVLGEEDVGCTLKVKCRPIRNDGYRGEVFTSRASKQVTCAIVTTRSDAQSDGSVEEAVRMPEI